MLGEDGIAGPIFSKNSSCKIAPDPKKDKFFSKHFIFSKSLFLRAFSNFANVAFVLSTYPAYSIL